MILELKLLILAYHLFITSVSAGYCSRLDRELGYFSSTFIVEGGSAFFLGAMSVKGNIMLSGN